MTQINGDTPKRVSMTDEIAQLIRDRGMQESVQVRDVAQHMRSLSLMKMMDFSLGHSNTTHTYVRASRVRLVSMEASVSASKQALLVQARSVGTVHDSKHGREPDRVASQRVDDRDLQMVVRSNATKITIEQQGDTRTKHTNTHEARQARQARQASTLSTVSTAGN